MITEREREIEMTRRILGGRATYMLTTETGRTGVRGGCAYGASATEIMADDRTTPESKLMALLEAVPAGIARTILATKNSIEEKIKDIRSKFFQD